jgi:hypothetical protein
MSFVCLNVHTHIQKFFKSYVIGICVTVQNPNNAIGILDAKVISIGTNILKRTAEAVDANLFSFMAEEYSDNVVS